MFKKLISKKQSCIVNLGEIKNNDKIIEIVNKLRLSGYCVYTLPKLPVHGQITRIFIRPDISKKKN